MPLPDPQPHLLVLNAAEGLLQFIIAREEPEKPPVPLCCEARHAPSQGAELLIPALQSCLRRLKLHPDVIRRIACVRGPGSFTGLRLVLTTAAGLARATGALQAGIDYLPLLASSAIARLGPFAAMPDSFWVCSHARRQLLHVQGFAVEKPQADHYTQPSAILEGQPPSFTPISEILVCCPEEAATAIRSLRSKATPASPVVLLGSGVQRNRPALARAFGMDEDAAQGQDDSIQFSGGRSKACFLSAAHNHPEAGELLRFAATARYTDQDVPPLYVRPSDAEENIEHIAASLGIDPARASEKLARLTGRAFPDSGE